MVSFFNLKSQKFDVLYELNRKIRNKKSWEAIYWEAIIEACLELFDSEFNPNEVDEEGTILLTGQTHEMGEKENEIIKLFEQNEISTEQ